MCRDRSSDFKAPVSVRTKYMILERQLVCLHFNVFSIKWKIGGTLTSIQPRFCYTPTETLNRSDSNPRKWFLLSGPLLWFFRQSLSLNLELTDHVKLPRS